jgi:hypothetical protein
MMKVLTDIIVELVAIGIVFVMWTAVMLLITCGYIPIL